MKRISVYNSDELIKYDLYVWQTERRLGPFPRTPHCCQHLFLKGSRRCLFCGNAAPAGARDPVSAGEYKMSISECRHFARDEFSLKSVSVALTPLSRSEFFPGSGPHALYFMSRPLQPPAPGPRAKCRFSLPLCPSVSELCEIGGAGPEARGGGG